MGSSEERTEASKVYLGHMEEAHPDLWSSHLAVLAVDTDAATAIFNIFREVCIHLGGYGLGADDIRRFILAQGYIFSMVFGDECGCGQHISFRSVLDDVEGRPAGAPVASGDGGT